MFHSLLSLSFYWNLLIVAVSAFDAKSKQNIAVYWGQNSAGTQQSLSEYCSSSDIDIVLLSFLAGFPSMELDLSNFCSGMDDCSFIGPEIQSCQQQGKLILLSLGGSSGQYGFNNNDEAEQFAQSLWDSFAGGSGVMRPFGDAVVDGFDFDIENKNPKGYAILAKKLREKFSSGDKQYYLSASPQCVYPDASVGDLLENAQIDFAFIQFYNNYCNVEGQFNWDTWKDFSHNISPNKDLKLFMGLPGSSSAASSGYIADVAILKETISKISSDSNFGGVALWDASQSFSEEANGQTYIAEVESALESALASSSDPTTTLSTFSTSVPFDGQSLRSTSTLSSNSPWSYSLNVQTPSVVAFTSGRFLKTLAPSLVSESTLSTGATLSIPTVTTVQGDPIMTSAFTSQSPLITADTSRHSLRPTTTIAPSSPDAKNAHLSAVDLNRKYSSGYTTQGPCEIGEIACTPDGNLAICNFGQWVTTECSAGTTCFAYDSQNSVLTGCNSKTLKSKFL